ncbi:MAG TPA: hypothetical protein VFU19_13485 [Iamia sp.]|nr:hypothetical protein [Iamia sp.]
MGDVATGAAAFLRGRAAAPKTLDRVCDSARELGAAVGRGVGEIRAVEAAGGDASEYREALARHLISLAGEILATVDQLGEA